MKKGISLIVLVITIIVIIILAGAVILSLSNNNPIAQAETAVADSDLDTVQSAVTLYLANIMATEKASVKVVAGDLDGAYVYTGTTEPTLGTEEYVVGTITEATLGAPVAGYTVDATGTVTITE